MQDCKFEDMKKDWQFQADHFGPFLPYLLDVNVTDVCWNGKALWIDDVTIGRYEVEDVSDITPQFIEQFTSRVANYAGVNFNEYETLLETQIDLYRISIVHEAAAHTGTSIAIRRTTDTCRLTKKYCLETGFCSEEVWNLFPKIIKSGFSCIAGGLPGVGKTEFLKMLSRYIPRFERAIVIEDSPEFHYRAINPNSDCSEWKITSQFTYEMALKASLRQRPEWNILAEARGRETQYLMENFSSGLKVLTSTHLDDEINLIPRLENMIGDSIASQRIKNEVYLRGLVVFVIKRKIDENGRGISRRLEQICFYSRENEVPTRTLIVDQGEIICRELPPNVMRKFVQAGYDDPFAILPDEEPEEELVLENEAGLPEDTPNQDGESEAGELVGELANKTNCAAPDDGSDAEETEAEECEDEEWFLGEAYMDSNNEPDDENGVVAEVND